MKGKDIVIPMNRKVTHVITKASLGWSWPRALVRERIKPIALVTKATTRNATDALNYRVSIATTAGTEVNAAAIRQTCPKYFLMTDHRTG
jgi:hypothetical protein